MSDDLLNEAANIIADLALNCDDVDSVRSAVAWLKMHDHPERMRAQQQPHINYLSGARSNAPTPGGQYVAMPTIGWRYGYDIDFGLHCAVSAKAHPLRSGAHLRNCARISRSSSLAA